MLPTIALNVRMLVHSCPLRKAPEPWFDFVKNQTLVDEMYSRLRLRHGSIDNINIEAYTSLHVGKESYALTVYDLERRGWRFEAPK